MRRRGYLAVGLGVGPLGAAGALLQGHLLQEGVALSTGEVGLVQLAEVELHGAVVADDVGEERLARQRVLGDPEGHRRLAAVLGERHLHLVRLEVLERRERGVWFILMCAYV